MFGFRDIEILQAIARAEGFRAAAARTGMSQSAMSNRVAALERRLGTRLFERRGRGVRPTAAGRRLLEESARLIAARDAIARELGAAGPLRGTVRIGVAETIVHTLLTPLLGALRQDHPAVRLELAVDASVELARGLDDDALDVAILLDEAVPGHLSRAPLAPVPVGWYAAAGRPADAVPLDLDALAGEPIVTYARGTLPHRRLERLFAGAGAAPSLHGSASLSTVRHLIAEGFGVGTLPRAMAARDGAVRPLAVCPEAAPDPLEFAVAWRAPERDDTGRAVAERARAIDAAGDVPTGSAPEGEGADDRGDARERSPEGASDALG